MCKTCKISDTSITKLVYHPKWIQNLHYSLRYEPTWFLKNSNPTLLLVFPLVNVFEESIGRIFPGWSSNTSRPSKYRLVNGNILHQILRSFLQLWTVNMQQKWKHLQKSKGNIYKIYKWTISKVKYGGNSSESGNNIDSKLVT